MTKTPKRRKRVKDESSRYLMIVKLALKFLELVGLPLYSSKYSRKDFTQHQLLVLLIIRQIRGGEGYESFAESLKDMTRVTEALGLKKLPCGSTLRKAGARIGNKWLDKMLLLFAGTRHGIRAGVDSTGMQLQSISHYYSKVLVWHSKKKKRRPGRPRKRKARKGQYFNVFSDLDKQLILGVKSARGKRSDAKSMIPLLKKIKTIKAQIGSVYADKGYDANYNFEYIAEELQAKPLILVREKAESQSRTRGEYRKAAKIRQERKIGRPPRKHRNKCETIFYVIKRKLGEHIRSTTAYMQRNELLYKSIAYNLLRITKIKIEALKKAANL